MEDLKMSDMMDHRLLDEEDIPDESEMGSVIRQTYKLYGTIFLILFTIFCVVRQRFPKAYNVRNSVESLHCSLAEDNHGYISWMWELFFVSDDEIFDQCGMDAVAFIRIMYFGFKVSILGIFNSIYLMPVYGTSPETSDTEHIIDRLQSVTLSNVPEGSSRVLATVFAAYILFGYTMYLILQEFEWFTKNRHKFLSTRKPNNYTVYVGGVPTEYRSSAKLLDYFRECFSYENVLEAHIAVTIPNLEQKVASRDAMVTNIEHLINVEEVTGKAPKHTQRLAPGSMVGKKVNSIDHYTGSLKKLNNEVSAMIEKIERENDPRSYEFDLIEAQKNSVLYQSVQKGVWMGGDSSIESDSVQFAPEVLVGDSVALDGILTVEMEAGFQDEGIETGIELTGSVPSEMKKKRSNSAGSLKGTLTSGTKHVKKKSMTGTKHVRNVSSQGTKHVKKLSSHGTHLAHGIASSGLKLLMKEDGLPRDAGFVTFTNLKTTMSALQIIHHHTPFTMQVQEAPLPEDIYWANVGISNKKKQLGNLSSIGLTTLTCLFWTIPVSFVASLSSVSALVELFPFVEDWVDRCPWLEPLLQQLAPLLVMVLISLLPVILITFAKMEAHIAASTLEASLFTKLAIFMIIQTFFVSIISGTILESLQGIIDDPMSAVTLLATALPAQSAYFMQIISVQTFIGLGLELLRVTPLVIAYLRHKFGPNLTEKERDKSWMGLYPLSNPKEFEHAEVLAEMILYFMVTFVYSVMAPITAYILAFNFFLLSMGYRNQLIYVYPPTNDSGGKLWSRFIQITMVCMLVAQITLAGVLLLKKSIIGVPLFCPLIGITILFKRYVEQKHFYVTNHLPSVECIKMDLRNIETMDFSFVRGKYIQPALQVKTSWPENFGPAREMAEEDIGYFTPPGSDAGDNQSIDY